MSVIKYNSVNVESLSLQREVLGESQLSLASVNVTPRTGRKRKVKEYSKVVKEWKILQQTINNGTSEKTDDTIYGQHLESK